MEITMQDDGKPHEETEKQMRGWAPLKTGAASAVGDTVMKKE